MFLSVIIDGHIFNQNSIRNGLIMTMYDIQGFIYSIYNRDKIYS
jgi:hypothetical protein